jgi:DNA-binding MarR family transcriptional regulator
VDTVCYGSGVAAKKVNRSALGRQAWTTIAGVFFGEAGSRRFHLACDAAGLSTPGALKALLSLDLEAPVAMRALAEMLRCDASYITGLVDELESAGYVNRVASPADRRIKLLQVSDSGRVARTKAEQIIHEPPKVMDRLTDAELATFAQLVAKLV